MILILQLIKVNYVKVLTVSSLGDFVANLRAKITDNHEGNEVQVFELGMSVLKSLSFQVRLSDKSQIMDFWLFSRTTDSCMIMLRHKNDAAGISLFSKIRKF